MAKSKAKSPAKPGCVRTLQEIATLSGISYTSIRQWGKVADFPREPDGTFSIWAIATWREKRLHAESAPQDGSDENLDRVERQLDIEHKRLKLRVVAGKLVSRAASKATVEQLFHAVRTRIEALPEELATAVPAEVRARVITDCRHKVQLACREMEAWSDAD